VPPLADQVDGVRRVAAAVGPAVPVIQTVFSPLSVADFLLGIGPKAVVPELQKEPGLLKAAMSRISETLVDFIRRSIEAGASGIFFGIVGFASGDVLSEREYQELALPHDLEVVERLPPESWFNVVHLCGSRVHFQLGSHLPGNAVSWSVHEDGNPSLEEGIERTGRAAMGGVAHLTTLSSGSQAAITNEVLAAAAQNQGKGVLVAPGCSVPTDVSETRLLAVSEALGAAPS
jgi:uroporphyrinogen decarboxylase